MKKFVSYDEAKKLLKELGINSETQFRRWSASERPSRFPSNPSLAYKNQWISWGDFLGTGRASSYRGDFMLYNEAKQIVQSAKIRNVKEFRQWWSTSADRPSNLPATPNIVYKDQWTSWREFLNQK